MLQTKNEYLVHVFDAHILGAVPPYNVIFGGKLVASLLQSYELNDIVSKRYKFRHGFPVILYTTTTVYGKSLMLSDTNWIYIGDTKGFSTFHLDYQKLREFLRDVEEAKRYKFGHGPNYPLRLARLASRELGIDITNIGTKRGFYILPLTSNYKKVLNGKEEPLFDLLMPMQKIVDNIKEKMIIPRAKRVKMKQPPKVSEIMKETEAFVNLNKILI